MSDNKYFLRFMNFVSILSERVDGFKVKYKDQSVFMKILGFLLFFNRGFMTNVTTTIGKTAYFTSKKEVETDDSPRYSITLGHEFRHVYDSRGFWKSIWFVLAYLFPQILAPFMLLLLPVSIWLSLILFVVFLTPLPAPGRMHYELKGYVTTLFLYNEVLKERGWTKTDRKGLLEHRIEGINDQFVSSDYYFMWPFGIKKQLQNNIDKIISGQIIEEDDFYRQLAEDFSNSSV